MEKLEKIVVILALAVLAGGVGLAQKRTQKYQPSELAANAAAAVAVDSTGISPDSIQRPVGAFVLAVRDDRGQGSEHFYVTEDADGAPELYSLDTTINRCQGAVLVDLQPGKYRLRLKTAPGLSVAITIKNK